MILELFESGEFHAYFISLSGKEQIIKGSRIAVRQGKDYWLATVTRRSSDGTVSLQYDEGTKDSGVSLRTATHLPDGTKASKKPLTKEQVQVLVEKGKAAAAKLKAAAEKAKPASKTTTKSGFRLTSKLGYVDFDVRHKPYSKGNRGLFTITPV